MATGLGGALLNGALRFADRTDWIARPLNRYMIGKTVSVARYRPHPLSTVHDYPSWRGLTDTAYSGRHLKPAPARSQPPVEAVQALFRRRTTTPRLCPKSTCLFPAFAQYLTDGFIRTETDDTIPDRLKRTTSNHEIDLCPLYGRTREQTDALRLRSATPGERGRLRSQMIDGEEYAPFLYKDGQRDPAFDVLDKPLGLQRPGGPDDPTAPDPERRDTIFAFGGDRANASPQVAMINTLLLREHNRLAGEIETAHPDWDDDRVFETARNTVIVIFIKIVVEEYINHISPMPFHFRADPKAVWRADWNRPNWITTEFSLLYRWHALVPDAFVWSEKVVPLAEILMDNTHLLKGGIAGLARDLSAQPAWEIAPHNTADALLHIEAASILQGRECDLASYAEYRDYVDLPRPRSFADITSDAETAAELKALYGKPENVEFYPGLFMEDRMPNSPLPSLIMRMVAVDAFSQALPNPLLSEHVFKEPTFSKPGWTAINETKTLGDLVKRNTPGGSGADIYMTRRDWQEED